MSVEILIFGEPVGKARARVVRCGRSIHAFTPERTARYESMVRLAAVAEMQGQQPFSGPVAVTIRAAFGVPASWSKKKRGAALENPRAILPAKRPDLDNVVKSVCDAMNGVVFRDDAQIVELVATKHYGKIACVQVLVEPLDDV
jgi:Holliday junction resolvase RusA-like endonuclease